MASASSAAPWPTPPESGLTSIMSRLSAACRVSTQLSPATAPGPVSGAASGAIAGSTAGVRVTLMPPERPARSDVPGGASKRGGLFLQFIRSRRSARLGRVAGLDGGLAGGVAGLVGDLRRLAPNGLDSGGDPAVHHGSALSERLFLDPEHGGQDAEHRQQGDHQADEGIAPAPPSTRPHGTVIGVIRNADRFEKTHAKPPSLAPRAFGAPYCQA